MTFISRLYRPNPAKRQALPPKPTKRPVTLASVAPQIRMAIHDANNALSIMSVTAGALLDDVETGIATKETTVKDLTDIKAAGTRLTILLKQLRSIVAQDESATVTAKTEAVSTTKDIPPYLARILVVDDDDPCRIAASSLLKKPGHTVKGAANPTQALAILAQEHFDLVVTDIDMGDKINGLDLLEIIKQNHPGTNVIVMSGHDEKARAEEASKKGASAFFPKPIEANIFLPTVHGCLPKK